MALVGMIMFFDVAELLKSPGQRKINPGYAVDGCVWGQDWK
jgi:hypothetical protein